MKLFTLNGYYGSGANKTEIFCAETNTGTWYVCEGGQTVSFTHEYMYEGVNVEHLSDVDCFTISDGINSLDELEQAINA